MNKGLKKALSYTLITTMVASMALTGFGGGARTVKAAGETYDSASLVNYSTILGRAVDFGILADTLAQTGSHTETNMAVNLYIGGNHANDPDLAGEEPLPFIIGGIQSGSNLSLRISANENPMTINIETNGYVIDNTIKHSFNKENLSDDERQHGYIDLTQANADDNHNGGHKVNVPNIDYNFGNFHTVFKRSSSADISNNIGLMIDHISDQSTLLVDAGTSRGLSINQGTQGINNYTLDLTDAKYVGKTVYIDVDRDGDLYRAIKTTGGLIINKDTSTVVVFNIKGTDPVILNKFFVNSTDSTTVNAAKDNTESGDKNSAVDTEICQKIIWNIPDADDVTLNASAGLFLVPNSSADVKINEGSSAGWIATGGTVTNVKSEFHYIYRGRSKTLSSNEDGAMHFAMRKAIYSGLDTNGEPIERYDIPITYAAYKFKLYETDESYDITNAAFLTFGSEDKPFGNESNPTTYTTHNDACSKILFPDIKVSLSDFVGNNTSITKYYVIKETNDVGTNPTTRIANNDGRVCIKLVANKVNKDGHDVVEFNVTSRYYLTSSDTTPWKTNGINSQNQEVGINMTGNEFSLGGFFNQYMEGGTLTVTKTISGDSAYAPQTDRFKITLTGEDSSNNALTGTYNVTGDAFAAATGTDLLTTITFTNGTSGDFYIAGGGSVSVTGLPAGAEIVVSEDSKTNYIPKTSLEDRTKTISSTTTQTVTLDNEYTAPTGNLRFTKTITGLNDTSLLANLNDVEFTVLYPDGVTSVTKKWSEMTAGADDYTKYFEIDNVKKGTYTVSESVSATNTGLQHYALDNTGGVHEVNVTEANTTSNRAQLSITNAYSHLENVRVEKVVSGATLPSGFNITNDYNSSVFTVSNKSGGDGSTANPYYWIIEDVPQQTVITFTENGYQITGYNVNVNSGANTDDSYSALGLTVSSTGSNTVRFTNEYTQQMVNLSVTKSWLDSNNADNKRPNSVTITLYENGTATSTTVVLNESNNWTDSVSVPKYDGTRECVYTWVEENVPSEYANTGNSTDNNNATTITNTYPIPGYAKLKLLKVVDSNVSTSVTLPTTYYAKIKDADNNYYSAAGVVVDSTSDAAKIALSTDSTHPTEVTLPTEKVYTVEEVTASVTGCDWTHTITGFAADTETVKDTTNKTVTFVGLANNAKYNGGTPITITNTYSQVGSLSVTKAQSTTGDTIPADKTFPISISFNATGEYVVNGAATTTHFEVNTAQVFNLKRGDTVTISNIPNGVTYTVTEDLTGETYYSNESITDNGTGTIEGGSTKAVTVTNSYSAPAPILGQINLTKAVAGDLDTSSSLVSGKTFTFTVTGPTGWGPANVTLGNGTWTDNTTLVNLPLGDYTIVEADAGIQGYNLAVSNNNSTLVNITDATPVDCTITNTYTTSSTTITPVDLTIKKVKEGGEGLAGAVLRVEKADGTEVTTFTSVAAGNTVSLSEAGDYKLIEVTPPADYQKAADITFKVVDDGNGNLSVVDASNNAITSITMTDAPVLKHDVKISKVDITNSREIVGAHLILYKDNGGGSYSQIAEWDSEINVRTFPLEAGDYAIKETVAPAGYEPAITLVKFNLSFDNQGKAIIVITDNDHNGTYDAAADVIKFEDDPIKVTGKLSVHVEEKKTGRPVPDAEVEVTAPDGTTKTYKTNGDGEIVDENGNTPINVSAGKYKIKIKSVPKGYDVDTGEVGDVTVPENGEGRHIAKIVSSTGGLKIKVLEEGTKREVPDATVVVEAPEGVKFPDGSTKITAITDKNGNITTYTGADGKTYDLTSGLTPGDYKITVTKVPAGYNVTVGESKTCKVVKDEIAEHVALIATSSNVQPAPAPAPAPAATPAATPATPTGSITNSINVKTGDDMNVYPALIAMALSLITGVSVVAFRRKRETK